jgi:hypothetical protein
MREMQSDGMRAMSKKELEEMSLRQAAGAMNRTVFTEDEVNGMRNACMPHGLLVEIEVADVSLWARLKKLFKRITA